MSNTIIRQVAVLGAGVMGAQIAAHCANAGIRVLLYELAASGVDRRGQARQAIQRLAKLKPPPLATPRLAQLITPVTYEDDLDRISECDLIIEAIAEQLELKRDLYRTIAPMIAPHAALVTNTSGLSIERLAEELDTELATRFCGMHFFNPPRYMPLVELIAHGATRPDVVDALESFLATTLGKSVVRAFDTPNFIANRVGVFSLLAAMLQADHYGITYDVADELTGARLGRAKSGTFRTADIVGLDTLAHVITTMRLGLPHDPFAPCFATPQIIQALVAKGALGQKAGAGFYRKSGRDILRLDPATGDYVSAVNGIDDEVARMLALPDANDRLAQLRQSTHPQAQFVWAVLRDTFHYVAVHLHEIARTARDVDLAMRWGFGHDQGPLELWQRAGWQQVAQWVNDDIQAGKALAKAPLPAWVTSQPITQHGGVHNSQGSWNAAAQAFEAPYRLPVYQRQIFSEALYGDGHVSPRRAGTTIAENGSARLWTLNEPDLGNVLIATLSKRMHLLDSAAIELLTEAVELAERDYQGLVIWQPQPPFSAGADLQALMPVFQQGGAPAIEREQRHLQDLMLRIRYAHTPVVAALNGMALGGGCELALYSARRVATLETYMGLVEAGVGLVPGSGGLAYTARRAAEEHAAAPDTDLLQFVKKYATQVAMAQVSTSAFDAWQMGYMQPGDCVVMHPRELLHTALVQACAMSDSGFRPPLAFPFEVAGRDGLATLTAQLVNMREGGFMSEHDFRVGHAIASVMCGGDVDPGVHVDEAWVMKLERQAFMTLLEHPKTQERIVGMLATGKPVRN